MKVAGVVTVSGDVTSDGLGLDESDLAIFTSCDIVIHSAAAVAFDSPLDSAVEINLLGLTFGIDPFSPALKLPLIGRIGAAR